MEIQRFQDPVAFYERALEFLLQHEAEHNLLLGISANLARRPSVSDQPPYLAVCREGDCICGVALRTPPHNVVLSRMETAECLPLFAADLQRRYAKLPGVLAPVDISTRFAESWSVISGQSVMPGRAERIYQLEQVRPVRGVPGELRRASEADRDLLIEWFTAFAVETGEFISDPARRVDDRLSGKLSGVYLWHDEQPVSLAGYGGTTPNGIRIGPVYTPPVYRTRGYASACVAAVSRLLLEQGRRYCFLFTDLNNPTPNHIYQAIGYQPVCDVQEVRFLAEASAGA